MFRQMVLVARRAPTQYIAEASSYLLVLIIIHFSRNMRLGLIILLDPSVASGRASCGGVFRHYNYVARSAVHEAV